MEAPQHVSTEYRTFRVEAPRDRALATLAAGQYGVVSLAQLRNLGLSASGVRERAAAGRLHHLHRGVYAIAPPKLLPDRARWLAAVLACGPRALLSHRSAAAVLRLRRDDRATTDVSLPSRSVRQRPGIHVHAAASLQTEDVTVTEGIRCTSVARTLFDLAQTRPPREVEAALGEAEVLRIFDGRAVEEVLKRRAGSRGAFVVTSVLARYERPTVTDSELEERLLALCRHRGEAPEVGAWIDLDGGAVKVDFLWRRQRLIVETDGRAVHDTRRAFERDRDRDRRLVLAGYRVVRFTWRQISREPDQVARTLDRLLAR